jgi:hypothetical protein
LANQRPSDVVESAPVVLHDGAESEALALGEVDDVDGMEDYGEAVVLRLIVAASETETISAEVFCEGVNVCLQRFAFDYTPAPFEPRAVERVGHAR